jgi:bacteriocin biosynthesis cyclodehydratase domain-containing protein
MTRFRSPDMPRVLVFGSGNVKDRFFSLVSDCDIEPISAAGDLDGALVESFAAAVIVAERPVPALELELDDACARSGTPWTSAVLLAQLFRIGPTVLPGRTPCHECWRRRIRSRVPDLRIHDAIQTRGEQREPERWFGGSLTSLDDQVAALLAAETACFATASYVLAPNRMGRYWQGDAIYGYLRAHQFAGIGTCSRCVSVELKKAGAQALGHFVHNHFPSPPVSDVEPWT